MSKVTRPKNQDKQLSTKQKRFNDRSGSRNKLTNNSGLSVVRLGEDKDRDTDLKDKWAAMP